MLNIRSYRDQQPVFLQQRFNPGTPGTCTSSCNLVPDSPRSGPTSAWSFSAEISTMHAMFMFCTCTYFTVGKVNKTSNDQEQIQSDSISTEKGKTCMFRQRASQGSTSLLIEI